MWAHNYYSFVPGAGVGALGGTHAFKFHLFIIIFNFLNVRLEGNICTICADILSIDQP